MTNTDVVKKLIGKITPIGETNTDNERFENLKAMCELVNNLITDIDNMAYQNRDAREFSVKRASEYAYNFLTNLTPKTIKDKSSFKLTNADISANYLNDKFHLMINDFKGAFVCWATKQNPNETYGVIADATQAYTKFLQQRYFKTKDTVIEMDCELIRKLTDVDLFVAIPEILALNQMKPDFIDLEALSRNVFYHILREQITQPL